MERPHDGTDGHPQAEAANENADEEFDNLLKIPTE